MVGWHSSEDIGGAKFLGYTHTSKTPPMSNGSQVMPRDDLVDKDGKKNTAVWSISAPNEMIFDHKMQRMVARMRCLTEVSQTRTSHDAKRP
jgi:hypothetical protein